MSSDSSSEESEYRVGKAHTEASDSEAQRSESPASSLRAAGALGRTGQASLSGESVSARGVFDTIGGVRGVLESLLPGLLFLVTFVFTQDARISAIAPAALAIIAVATRLIRKEPPVSAFSGAIAVAVCVAATLLTGRGEDYFLPGFWINGAWILALTVSVIVGWPLLGVMLGALRGDVTGWRADPLMRRAALTATLLWLALFVVRLAVQLPLYFSGAVEALGVARLVMGVPLFALVVLFTWLLLSRASLSSDDPGPSASDTGA